MSSGQDRESAECKRYHDWMKMLDEIKEKKGVAASFPLGEGQGRFLRTSGLAAKFLRWRVGVWHDDECVPEMKAQQK
jgi:hypothetical protein